MTEGERFIGLFPRKVDFHDRSKRRSYELARRVAARLLDEPDLIARGRAHLERWTRPDPRQSHAYALWAELLGRDVRQVVSQLLEDSPRGEWLRDTQSVFVVLPPQERGPHARLRTEGARPGSVRMMRREKLDHILRAAAGVTGHGS